jgi:hypothetical protein
MSVSVSVCVYVRLLSVVFISLLYSSNHYIQENDRCGSSLTNIGDINRDDLRSKHPLQPREKGTKHFRQRLINDLVVGCSQSNSESGSGKFLFLFMRENGLFENFLFPPSKYPENGPQLSPNSGFATSMTYLSDTSVVTDLNPIPLVIGSPGGQALSANSGSLYIVYLYRRKYHPAPFNIIAYYLKIVLPLFFVCMICVILTTIFFIYFRRKPDEIEIAVKKAGIEIGLQRKRAKAVKVKDATVYADEYT